MRQTWAVFLDAYRELNARKLFWIAMSLSVVVVAAFACVGLTPKGISVLWWEFPNPALNSTFIEPATLYKLMFQEFGVKFWLTWISAILALIATCGMIPEFVSGGSIELTLSKPIGRLRMFLTKYAAGLLFTFLQVGAFSLATLLVLGLRGGVWDLRVLWAVPLVTVFYSYLFCMCALVGLLTRSTIFSLIATILLWLFVFALGMVESQWMLRMRISTEAKVQEVQQQIDAQQSPAVEESKEADKGKGLGGAFMAAIKPKPTAEDPEKLRKELAEAKADEAKWRAWHQGFFALKTVLPKTTETSEFLSRLILDQDEKQRIQNGQDDRREKRLERRKERQEAAAKAEGDQPRGPDGPGGPDDAEIREMVRQQMEIQKRLDERSSWWVIGTSLGFEGVVLGIACWVFCRRDF